MHTGLVVMLINQDSCPILSFLCVETEGTDFYQHKKYFRSVNAYQLLLIFRINLISFIHLFEIGRVFYCCLQNTTIGKEEHGSLLQVL